MSLTFHLNHATKIEFINYWLISLSVEFVTFALQSFAFQIHL